jgi:hypothetical protein
MPIDYRVDHSRRLVIARGSGTVTDSDVFGYQRKAWSRADVAGYDELVDMSGVEAIAGPIPGSRLRQLAAESAATDPPGGAARFALVAPEPFAFGLGRLYQAYRDLQPRGTKEVAVFRTLREALAYLGIESLAE